MGSMTQKKFSISSEQESFLTEYKKWGFSDQSSIVREALDHFIKEIKTRERKNLMKKMAGKLLVEYSEDKELTVFTDLDGEDFI